MLFVDAPWRGWKGRLWFGALFVWVLIRAAKVLFGVFGVHTMAMITVQVWDATGNKRQEVELPDDAPVNRILAVLLDRMSLPQNAPDGQPLSYKFFHKRSGKQVLDEQCLADVGVQEGDVLRLQPEITAGGTLP